MEGYNSTSKLQEWKESIEKGKYKNYIEEHQKSSFSLCNVDSYKGKHPEMMECVTNAIILNTHYYFTARKGTVTFFGLQKFLMDLQNTKITKQEIECTVELFKNFGGFDREPWDFVVNECNGIIPITIEALPEGITVPPGTPLFRISATKPEFAPAVGYLETWLSHVWYLTSVATKSNRIKQQIAKYLKETSNNFEGLPFMLHGFGCRGNSSMESASAGDAAHLVNFKGTDTIPGVLFLMYYYASENPAFSVKATEHSVMTTNGPEGEKEVYEKLLTTYTEGILSIVIDAYNQYNVVEALTTDFLPLIKGRNGKVVIRPDSGDPLVVIPKLLKIVEKNIGNEITINDKGFKLLPSYIGLLWGDGLNEEKITEILQLLQDSNWSAENIVFGMGGGLIQKLHRDTYGCAFKMCGLYCINMITGEHEFRDIYKKPIDGGKTSFKGIPKVIIKDNEYITVRADDSEYADYEDQLRVVYENGKLYNIQTLEQIRELANTKINQILYGP